MKLLVTGGCGFIGSNFVRHVFRERPEWEIRVLDLLTYSGNLENLGELLAEDRLDFVRGDIADPTTARSAVEGMEAVTNFAAESHVDRSILDAAPFIRSNILGTQVLLDVAREAGTPRFLQISTDEVYGSLGPEGGFTEDTPLAPNSPYSASKASADFLVRAYVRTHGFPGLIVRSSNAYGPFQFIEKLIPLMMTNAFEGHPLPVYGDGLHVRDWIHVEDLCGAVLDTLEGGGVGEVYNVGGGNELTNLEVVRGILQLVGAPESLIQFVPDRPGHDRRYAMDHSKITRELGWTPDREFEVGLAETVAWYRANPRWVESLQTGRYREYYQRQYASRLAQPSDRP